MHTERFEEANTVIPCQRVAFFEKARIEEDRNAIGFWPEIGFADAAVAGSGAGTAEDGDDALGHLFKHEGSPDAAAGVTP